MRSPPLLLPLVFDKIIAQFNKMRASIVQPRSVDRAAGEAFTFIKRCRLLIIPFYCSVLTWREKDGEFHTHACLCDKYGIMLGEPITEHGWRLRQQSHLSSRKSSTPERSFATHILVVAQLAGATVSEIADLHTPENCKEPDELL